MIVADMPHAPETGATAVPPRRFLFFVGEHVGHLHAVLGVARRLQQRGHEVGFVTAHPTAAVTAAGFACRRVPWLAGPDTTLATRPQREAAMAAWLRAAADGARRLLAEHAPDVLLFQPFLLGLYPFFHCFGVPAATFSTKPLLTPDPLVPPYTCSRVPSATACGRLQVRCDWWAVRARYAAYRLACAWQQGRTGHSHRATLMAAARHAGFPLAAENCTRPLSFDIAFRSVPELVLHAREFDFARALPLPPGAAYLGPCLDLQRAAAPFAPPPGYGPLVYCNLGTVGRQLSEHKRALYRHVLEAALRAPEWRLVLATGDDDTAQWLRVLAGGCGDRIRVCSWAPQMSALAHADLLINHAGANSTKEALYHGIPVLAFPQHADQPGIGARLVYHQVGLVADQLRATPQTVTGQVRRLLAEAHYRQQAVRFSAIFRRYDDAAVAPRLLERLAQRSPVGR